VPQQKWLDNCVAIGSRREPTALAKSVDAKYGTAGLGEVRWALGMLLQRDRSARTISISQEAFSDSILTCFNFADAATVTTPLAPGTHLSVADCPMSEDEKEEMANRPYRELAGALAWLALETRPDITFAASSLTRFGHNLGCVHWETAKRVLRYIKGTKDRRLYRCRLGVVNGSGVHSALPSVEGIGMDGRFCTPCLATRSNGGQR